MKTLPRYRTNALALAGLMTAIVLVSCAEGSGPVDETNNSADMASNSVNNTNNTSTNNVNNVADMGPDASECDLCCPGDVACLEDGRLGLCASNGRSFIPSSCPTGQVCEAGACITPPVCTAGESRCYDSTTVLTCRQSGDGFATMQCPAGESCFSGTCGTGDAIGAVCSDDSTCVTGNCHCGSGTDEPCPASITNGYCTTTSCDFESCGQDSVCLIGELASLANAEADYDHCVPRCEGICQDGFECRQVPIRGENGVTEWARGCYFPGQVDIGADCTSDGQCIAGNCLQGYFDTGYCTRRCDADGACPDGSGCVELKTGEFYCSLLCGDGSVVGTQKCPLDLPQERFDVTCRTMATSDGGVVRACADL